MKHQESVVGETKRLHYELSIVNDINRKLSEELKEYQHKYNLQPKKYIIKSDELSYTNLSGFMQQLYYVEPLLISYQAKISKLQQLASQLQSRSAGFDEKAYQLTSQNDFLREELEQKCKIVLQRQSSLTGMDIKYLRLENQAMRQKEQLIKQENSALKKQLASMKDQMECAQRQQAKESSNKGLGYEMDRMKGKERQLVLENMSLSKQLDMLKAKHKGSTTLSETQDRSIMELESGMARLQNQNKILLKKVQTTNDTHYHTVVQLETENQTLKSQLKETQRHEANLFQKNLEIQNEIQSRQHDTHNLQLKVATLESNNNNLLQMIESYEGKLAQVQRKLRASEEQLKQHNQKLKQMSKERDILAWKVEEVEERIRIKDGDFKIQRQRFSRTQHDKVQIMKRNTNAEKEKMESQLIFAKTEFSNLQSKLNRASNDRSMIDDV